MGKLGSVGITGMEEIGGNVVGIVGIVGSEGILGMGGIGGNAVIVGIVILGIEGIGGIVILGTTGTVGFSVVGAAPGFAALVVSKRFRAAQLPSIVEKTRAKTRSDQA